MEVYPESILLKSFYLFSFTINIMTNIFNFKTDRKAIRGNLLVKILLTS